MELDRSSTRTTAASGELVVVWIFWSVSTSRVMSKTFSSSVPWMVLDTRTSGTPAAGLLLTVAPSAWVQV